MPGQRMFGVSPTSDSGTGGWVHADPPSPRAVADAEELPSTLLMIGETGDQPNSDLWGVRLAGPVPVDGAPARVEALSRFDIVWLREADRLTDRSEEHTSELQSLMRTSYAAFCLKKKKQNK